MNISTGAKRLATTRTFIDTLFVVALINVRDQYHPAAREMAQLYEGQPFLTTDAVLLEVGNALARGHKPEAVQAISDILTSTDTEVVRLTPELYDRTFVDLYRSHQDKEWGLVDCVSFVAMREAGVTDALTFDRHFAQAGFRPLLRERN